MFIQVGSREESKRNCLVSFWAYDAEDMTRYMSRGKYSTCTTRDTSWTIYDAQYMDVYVCIHIHLCIYSHAYICIYLNAYICIYTCIHVSLSLCVHIYMNIEMYWIWYMMVYIYDDIHRYTYIYTYICMYIHMHIYIYIYIYIRHRALRVWCDRACQLCFPTFAFRFFF